jgi:hypothetical protein
VSCGAWRRKLSSLKRLIVSPTYHPSLSHKSHNDQAQQALGLFRMLLMAIQQKAVRNIFWWFA